MEIVMPRQGLMDGIDKHTGQPIQQKRRRMRQLRMWLPDTSTPEFQAEARRQAAVLRGAPEEAETLDFIEKAGDFSDE
jgi:hypothetical protein